MGFICIYIPQKAALADWKKDDDEYCQSDVGRNSEKASAAQSGIQKLTKSFYTTQLVERTSFHPLKLIKDLGTGE